MMRRESDGFRYVNGRDVRSRPQSKGGAVLAPRPHEDQEPAPADIVVMMSWNAFMKRPISSSVPIDTRR